MGQQENNNVGTIPMRLENLLARILEYLLNDIKYWNEFGESRECNGEVSSGVRMLR